MKTKHKIIGIIVLALVANIGFAPFALAQATTPPATPPSTLKFDKEKLGRAQKDAKLCKDFGEEIKTASEGKFQTIYEVIPQRTGTQTKCTIVPAAIDITSTNAGRVYQPVGSENLQTQIEQGNGVSAADLAKFSSEDEKDQNQANILSKLIGWVLSFIFKVVNSVLGALSAMALKVMTIAIEQTFVGYMPKVVDVGWAICRDISNMFFILIMIVMALAAILRLQEYDYRHLMGEVVLMAILVNFSQVIAVTLINFVNYITAVFAVPGDFKTIFSFVYGYVWQDVGSLPNGWMTGLAQGLTQTVFTIVTFVVSIMLAGLFVIRLVGLYVLVILSPFAYVLDVLPATKHFGHEWWQAFVKYLIWAPVAMFFIRLAVAIVQNDGLVGGFDDSAFKFVILSAFLIAAVVVAEHAGMAGGKMLIGGVEKAAHWAGHTAAHWGDRKLASWATSDNRAKRALSNLSVISWKKGREALMHHKEEEAYTVAVGKRADQWGKLFGGPGDFQKLSQYTRIAQERKRLENINDKLELVAQVQHAFEEGHIEKAIAGSLKLAAQGDINEVPLALHDPDATGDRVSYVSGAEGLQKAFMDNVAPTMGRDYTLRMLGEIGKLAENAEHWNFAGIPTFDTHAHAYRARTEAERAAYVNVQRPKSNMQQRIRNIGRLGSGFEEYMNAHGEQISLGPNDEGMGFMRSIGPDQMQEDERNGNDSRHANIVINGSLKVMREAPIAWVTPAEKFARAFIAGDQAALDEFHVTAVATPANPAVQTISPEHAREFFANNEEFKPVSVFAGGKYGEKYIDLYRYSLVQGPPRNPNPAPGGPAPAPAHP